MTPVNRSEDGLAGNREPAGTGPHLRRSIASRLAGFALIPALSALSTLILLPVVARMGGSDAWTSLAVGQTLGSVASVIAGLAWPFVGGHRIAAAAPSERRETYALSLMTRGAVLLVTVSLASLYLLIVAPPLMLTTWVFMIGTAGNALSAAWYYAGIGRPRLLVYSEGLPRLMSYVISVLLLVLTRDLMSYALATVAFQLVAFAINYRVIFGTFTAHRVALTAVVAELRDHGVATLSRTITSLGESGGPILMAALHPNQLGTFTALDAVFKAGRNATHFLPSAFISWVGEHDDHSGRSSRSRQALLFVGCTSLAGLMMWQLVGAWCLSFLFDGQIGNDQLTVLAIGLSVFGGLMVYSVELLGLVPQGRSNLVFVAQLATAILAIALFPALAMLGPLAAFCSYLIAYAARGCFYAFLSIRMTKRRHRSSPSRD